MISGALRVSPDMDLGPGRIIDVVAILIVPAGAVLDEAQVPLDEAVVVLVLQMRR